MFPIIAATTLSLLGTHPVHGQGLPGYLCCDGGFAPNIHNGALVTRAPEDSTRVYSPGISENSGRPWIGDDVRDLRARRTTRQNPGRLAYGAADADNTQVRARVGNVVVTISPWEKIDAEGLTNLERARQQWLKERGYTQSVRSFTNTRAQQHAQAEATSQASPDGQLRNGILPPPSATIHLRKPRSEGGINKHVNAHRANTIKHTSQSSVVQVTASTHISRPRFLQSDGAIHISLPPTARADMVARVEAHGWAAPQSAVQTRKATRKPAQADTRVASAKPTK